MYESGVKQLQHQKRVRILGLPIDEDDGAGTWMNPITKI